MKSRKRAIWTLTPSVAGALILVVDSMIALPAFGNITGDPTQQIPQVLASAPEQELTVKATEVLEGIGEQRALSDRELIYPMPPRFGRGYADTRLAESLEPGVPHPPVEVSRLLQALRERLRQAEGAYLSKDMTRAAALLKEVDQALVQLRHQRASDIPQGHVGAFVLEERIEVLKKQLSTVPAAADEPARSYALSLSRGEAMR